MPYVVFAQATIKAGMQVVHRRIGELDIGCEIGIRTSFRRGSLLCDLNSILPMPFGPATNSRRIGGWAEIAGGLESN